MTPPDPATALAEAVRTLSARIEADAAVARRVLDAIRNGADAGPFPGLAETWDDGDTRCVLLVSVAGYAGGAAGMLAMFARDAIRGHRGPPGDALAAANVALRGLGLAEPAFVSVVYARIEGGTVAFARAGLPPPVYHPPGGGPGPWAVPGPHLGVCDAEWPTRAGEMASGGRLEFVGADGATVLAVGSPADTIISLTPPTPDPSHEEEDSP